MMHNRHGEQTGLFGEWLTRYLVDHPNNYGYTVYYDHGDSQASPNVVAIKGFFGDELSSQNQLTQVDVMIVNPNREVIMIIEVEERASSPKKIVGDVITNLMCDHFSVRLGGENQYFGITLETKLLIAGIISTKGSKVTQLENVISPRLQQFAPLQDGINPSNVDFVFREDIESTIESLKDVLIELFS